MRRTVISGVGAISCLGQSIEDITQSLRKGTSGVVFDPERKALGFRSALTGSIPGFDASRWFDRKARKTMGQAAQYGCAASMEAIADAKLNIADLAKPSVGIIFGNDSTCDGAYELFAEHAKYKRTAALGTSHIIKTMNSSVTMNLSTLIKAQGACWTLSAACASGLHSIGQALWMVSWGMQDIVIAGGAQETAWQGMAAFDALGALSTQEENPTTASRPFDQSRDGLVPSGGGAAVIVESLDSARARNAPIYAEILGYGFSGDGGHLTTPTGDGAQRAMEMALHQAHVHPKELDFIHAHATSTQTGDAVEAQAIRRVLEGHQAPVVSTKGQTGHECWMAGASEIIYSVLMMRAGFIAGNVNLTTPDEAAAGLHLPVKTLATRPRTILKNSFGFGGTNASVVLRSLD